MSLHHDGPDGPAGTRGSVPEAVLDARRRLTQLPDVPVAGHVEVFDQVHRLLQDALATLDEA